MAISAITRATVMKMFVIVSMNVRKQLKPGFMNQLLICANFDTCFAPAVVALRNTCDHM